MNKHSWHDPHIIRSKKSFLQALYITLGVFLFLFVAFHIGGSLYISSIVTKASRAFDVGIAKDLLYLKEQGDIISKNPLVQQYIQTEDSEKLISVLHEERSVRHIGLMGVANSEGVVIARTKSVGRRGDNVFLTNPVGRVVAKGQSAESVEAPVGFDPHQIFITTGRPVIKDGQMIGALFANYLADDTYAIQFRDTYLPAGVEVVFYNKNAGIYGNSFSDPETRTLINSYFNSGSTWIKDGDTSKTISFKNGTLYLVENTIFPGLEKSPGGALIFVPRYDISKITNSIIALLMLLTFIVCALYYHIRNRKEERGWRYYVLLSLVSIPVFVLSFSVLYVQHAGFSQLKHIPYVLYNSTLRFQPEFGIYDMGFEQRFSIIVDTGDESINTVDIGFTFDPTAVEVKGLDTKNSACSYVIENSVDITLGKAHIACAILKKNGERGSVRIADVVVVPKRAGTFTLAFDKTENAILANDGLGTNVLRTSQDSSYRVDTFDLTPLSDSSLKGITGRSFVIFSPTHANQSRWYSATTAHFVWKGKPDAVYAYAFDTTPNTTPSKIHTIQASSIDLPIPGDGIFYFHLQLVSGGPIAHYRVQSDQTPPRISSIHLNTDTIFKGDVVRFSFEAEDAGSGIEENYYVDLGNHLFLPTGSQLFVPFLDAGDQTLLLRVYDNAGNYSEKSEIIHVQNLPKKNFLDQFI